MGHEPKLWGRTKTVPQGAHPLYRLSTASKRKIYQSEKRKVIGQTTQLDNHIGAIGFWLSGISRSVEMMYYQLVMSI
jgi:hypothetical protein